MNKNTKLKAFGLSKAKVSRDHKKLAQEWFLAGENDFKAGKIGFEKGAPYNPICVMFQQAAEKLLKGIFILMNKKPPRIHHLEILLQKIKENIDIDISKKEAEFLSQFYFESRYPPDLVQANKTDVEKALDICSELRNKFKELLQK